MPKIHAPHFGLLRKSAISQGQSHFLPRRNAVLMGGPLARFAVFSIGLGSDSIFFSAIVPLSRFSAVVS